MSLFDLDDKVTAAAVAAAGTVIGTLIHRGAASRHTARRRNSGSCADAGVAQFA
jgi:hypothetical protein